MPEDKTSIITLSNGRQREVIRYTTMSGEVNHLKDIKTGRCYSEYSYYDCLRQLEADLLEDEKASCNNVDVTQKYQRLNKQIQSLTEQLNKLCAVDQYDYVYADERVVCKLRSSIDVLNKWIIDTVTKTKIEENDNE